MTTLVYMKEAEGGFRLALQGPPIDPRGGKYWVFGPDNQLVAQDHKPSEAIRKARRVYPREPISLLGPDFFHPNVVVGGEVPDFLERLKFTMPQYDEGLEEEFFGREG